MSDILYDFISDVFNAQNIPSIRPWTAGR